MNPRVLTEFVDGTKTMGERVALANATGLRIDLAGMHGPNAELKALSDIFRLRTDGGPCIKKALRISQSEKVWRLAFFVW